MTDKPTICNAILTRTVRNYHYQKRTDGSEIVDIIHDPDSITRFAVTVDLDKIATLYAEHCHGTKSRRSKLLNGCVTVEECKSL